MHHEIGEIRGVFQFQLIRAFPLDLAYYLKWLKIFVSGRDKSIIALARAIRSSGLRAF